ncbi:MAG TPA: hypothetical protein VG096_26490 [Bryobacteraceae bacterium]|jgi:hypothetical protein|nr:hypothetical protein [Bryobacteraceae bacterium]
MALFTDGCISDLEDLIALDSQLLDVATVEGIDVTRKLVSAQDEIGLELITLLDRLHFTDQPFWMPPQPRLSDVVVTKPLKLWHTYRALEMVYSDAYSSQLNDRYGAKRDQFHKAAQGALEKLIRIGVGVASYPVPRAQPPQVTPIPGGLADGVYYVTMAWVNSAGEEGASAIPVVTTLSASTIQVQPTPPPPTVAGWNLYAGHAPDRMVLQNSSPIPTGEMWIQTGALAQAGNAPGAGQEPNYLKPIPRILQRG